MKFATLILSLILGASFAFAASKPAEGKKKRYRRARTNYSANAAVYSLGEIIRHIALNNQNIGVVVQNDGDGKENGFWVSTGRTLSSLLEEHRQNGDKVRYDRFSCKAAQQVGLLNCRLMVVENLKKGEIGLTAYYFKVARDGQRQVRIVPPMNPELIGGEIAGASLAVVEYLSPEKNPTEFREFQN